MWSNVSSFLQVCAPMIKIFGLENDHQEQWVWSKEAGAFSSRAQQHLNSGQGMLCWR